MNVSVRRGPRVWLTILVLTALLFGCGQEKPPALIKSAKEFIAQRNFSAASIQLKNALQQQDDLRAAG